MLVRSYIPPLQDEISVEALFPSKFFDQARRQTFERDGIEFLSSVSASILSRPNIMSYPELVALAYWLRKTNLTNVRQQFLRSVQGNQFVVPRGVALHVAPSNVDSIFLYSWCLSLLAGNINIIRISRTLTDQMVILLSVLNTVLQDERWRSIRQTNVVITYEHDERVNGFFSSRADVRIIWGGDETIQTIRNVRAKPTTKDLTFADKVSYTAIDASAFLTLPEAEQRKIGKGFYNDTYWFDQKACSSPRILFLVGTPQECETASRGFWDLVKEEVKQHAMTDSASIAMTKLVFAFEAASRSDHISLRNIGRADAPSVISVDVDVIEQYRETCGGGFFFQCFVPDISAIVPHVRPNDQTLTYYGFDRERLTEFVQSLQGRGIDRIVPVGNALSFSTVWDGYVLLEELTKRVLLQ